MLTRCSYWITWCCLRRLSLMTSWRWTTSAPFPPSVMSSLICSILKWNADSCWCCFDGHQYILSNWFSNFHQVVLLFFKHVILKDFFKLDYLQVAIIGPGLKESVVALNQTLFSMNLSIPILAYNALGFPELRNPLLFPNLLSNSISDADDIQLLTAGLQYFGMFFWKRNCRVFKLFSLRWNSELESCVFPSRHPCTGQRVIGAVYVEETPLDTISHQSLLIAQAQAIKRGYCVILSWIFRLYLYFALDSYSVVCYRILIEAVSEWPATNISAELAVEFLRPMQVWSFNVSLLWLFQLTSFIDLKLQREQKQYWCRL